MSEHSTAQEYSAGDFVWLMESARMCQIVRRNKDGTYTIARLDTGKELIATPEGLEAA